MRLSSRIQQIIGYQQGEGPALFWGWLYMFSLFAAYYVLRPIRDEMGAAGGVHNLPWLFTGTLVAMLILNPLFSALVCRWSRERFIAIAYHFFMANLLLFIIAIRLSPEHWHIWLGRIFFIWVSVFNLFVISVCWSLLVDVFASDQGKKLFGVLATGATAGGIIGPGATSLLVAWLGQTGMMVFSILFLELAVVAAHRLSRLAQSPNQPLQHYERHHNSGFGGSIYAGIMHTFRSPYLLGIVLFLLCQTITATFLYFEQAHIAKEYFTDKAERTAFFANIDVIVNILTLSIQLFLTGRLVKSFGVGLVLCALPFICFVGFSSLTFGVSVGLFVTVQVARRVSNYALSRPTREILFTVISREDRYKAKNFIDTVIYRAGDQLGSWSYAGLMALGLSLSGLALTALPITLFWLVLSLWLGRQQQRQQETTAVD